MKKIFIYSLLFIAICFSSCTNNRNSNNQPISQPTTALEGVWKLQNINTGTQLTFQGQNWTLNSGTVIISGTFILSNNQINGLVVSRSGANNGGLQPDTFTGNIDISNKIVTFTNFSGNWSAVFSTWYQKQ